MCILPSAMSFSHLPWRALSPHPAPHPHLPAGAPAPGLVYLDWLAAVGALNCAPCSFPVMGRAAGGLAGCADSELGDRVLHLFCGSGALTKLLASQGLQARAGEGGAFR